MDRSEAARLALEDAVDAIILARESAEPITWLTGNAYMPPLRAWGSAEVVWQATDLHEDPEGDYWTVYVETFEATVTEGDVYLDSPEYDNSLYVVDLRRWEYVESPQGEFLGDDWVPKAPEGSEG